MTTNYIKALDFAKEGDWHAAHELIQSGSDTMSCLIHAYLHRVEGDLQNAGYWYRRAGTKLPSVDLAEELAGLYEKAGGIP